MSNIRLTLGCGDYDLTRALIDGTVRPPGIDLTVLPMSSPERHWRMMRFEEFDVAELSLSTYVLTAQRDAPFVAIPVFPSRAFRALMGGDYWSYGLGPANRVVLSTFLRYAREQGLAGDGIEPGDLFAPETRDELVI